MRWRDNDSVPLPASVPPPYVDIDERLPHGRPPLALVASPPTVIKVAANQPVSNLWDLLLDQSEDGKDRWTEFMEDWANEAAREIRQLAEFVRANGASNFGEVLERVDSAARSIEQASLQSVESAKGTAEIARGLLRDAQQYARTLPEMAPRFVEQAEKAGRQVARLQRQAEAYVPVLEAYRDALHVLVKMRDASIMEGCVAVTLASLGSEDGGDI